MIRKPKGFTLIEIMITVAIVAILAAVAMPSYTSYVQRGNRADARNTLLAAAQRMEQNYNLAGRYDTLQDGTTAVNTAMLTTWGLNRSPSSGTQLYTISFNVAPDRTSYVLAATPVTGTVQANDTCGELRLTERSLKAAKGENPNTAGIARNANTAECWNK